MRGGATSDSTEAQDHIEIECGRIGRGEIICDENRRLSDGDWSLINRIDQVEQDALPRVAQIDGASGDNRIVELLHLIHPFVDDLLTRPRSAVPLINKGNGLHNECVVVEEFAMDTENGRLARAKACLDLLVQLVKLGLCSVQSSLQTGPFGGRVAGVVFDDDGGLLHILANRTDGQSAGRGNASEGCTCCLWSPA